MEPTNLSQGIITCILARHAGEAVALGRSLKLNSPELRTICVVEGELDTVQREDLSSCFSEVVPLDPRHFKMGWLVKHIVWEYSPFDHTLFLDSDCLVLRDLRPAFEVAGDRHICFAAKAEPSQEKGAFLYAGISLDYLMKRFNADWWPQILGGGHFFFRKTAEAEHLFKRALEWGAPELIHEFGWTEKSKAAPDELTLQIALVEAGLGRASALVDYQFVCWTPWESAQPDVFAGNISLRDHETGVRRVDDRYSIAHFGGDATNANYRREQWRLWLFAEGGRNPVPGTVAWLAKPWLHIAAHGVRKGRNGWHRLCRNVIPK